MDHALGEETQQMLQVKTTLVLILVLVDHALGVDGTQILLLVLTRLNPCFSGPCSRSAIVNKYVAMFEVLILVLVDHALGDYIKL